MATKVLVRARVDAQLRRLGVRPISHAEALRIERALDARIRGLRARQSGGVGLRSHFDEYSRFLARGLGEFFHDRSRSISFFVYRHPPKRGERVVELGCGPALPTIVGGKLHPKVSFRGFDFSGDMIRQARLLRQRAGPNKVTFNVMRPGRVPLKDESVAQVWLENSDQEEGVVSEAVRIVKPGGVIKLAMLSSGDVKLAEDQARRYLVTKLPKGFTLDVTVVRSKDLPKDFNQVLVIARKPK